ncbi:hypothetical protein BDW69DRAFT_187580 [Aspergillus filifer]
MAVQSKILTGEEVLSQPLKPLLTRKGYRTTPSALHSDKWYVGPIGDWQVEEEAKLVFNPGNKGNLVPVNFEQFVCGEEGSVCGRFIQNALSPATAVAVANGIKSRFSDFKSCAEGKSSIDDKTNRHNIPDFVAIRWVGNNVLTLEVGSEPFMILVGEGKTHWKHDLGSWYKKWKKDKSQDRELRHALGQLAQYMYVYKVKYGFLTTYDETIFVFQDLIEDKDGNLKPGLRVSRPIKREDTPSKESARLSVRQCLYYLLDLTKGDAPSFKYQNSVPLEQWIEKTNVPANQDKAPQTPARRQLETPQQAISAMSPNIVKKTSQNDRMKLYRAANGIYTSIMCFDHHQIRPEGVMVDGKWIRVDIEGAEPGHNIVSDQGLASKFQGLGV